MLDSTGEWVAATPALAQAVRGQPAPVALRGGIGITAARLIVRRAAAARVTAASGLPLLVATDVRSASVLDGVVLPPGALVAIPAGGACYLRATAPGTWFAVAGGGPLPLVMGDPGDSRALLTDPGLLRGLVAAAGDWLDDPAALEHEVVDAATACLAGACGLRAGARSRRALMDQFEQLVRQARHRNPSMERLAEILGVAPRTLRACVRDFVGFGPARFVHRHRLEVARDCLLAAEARGNSVTALALSLGFTELGRFSVAYRAQFGEPPSATLHRTPVPAAPAPEGLASLLRLAG
jgi:AraC-like DNA-binding protein